MTSMLFSMKRKLTIAFRHKLNNSTLLFIGIFLYSHWSYSQPFTFEPNIGQFRHASANMTCANAQIIEGKITSTRVTTTDNQLLINLEVRNINRSPLSYRGKIIFDTARAICPNLPRPFIDDSLGLSRFSSGQTTVRSSKFIKVPVCSSTNYYIYLIPDDIRMDVQFAGPFKIKNQSRLIVNPVSNTSFTPLRQMLSLNVETCDDWLCFASQSTDRTKLINWITTKTDRGNGITNTKLSEPISGVILANMSATPRQAVLWVKSEASTNFFRMNITQQASKFNCNSAKTIRQGKTTGSTLSGTNLSNCYAFDPTIHLQPTDPIKDLLTNYNELNSMEKFYKYNHPGGVLEFSLHNSNDHVALLFKECAQDKVINGTINNKVGRMILPAGLYYIVIDGKPEAGGNFELIVNSK